VTLMLLRLAERLADKLQLSYHTHSTLDHPPIHPPTHPPILIKTARRRMHWRPSSCWPAARRRPDPEAPCPAAAPTGPLHRSRGSANCCSSSSSSRGPVRCWRRRRRREGAVMRARGRRKRGRRRRRVGGRVGGGCGRDGCGG